MILGYYGDRHHLIVAVSVMHLPQSVLLHAGEALTGARIPMQTSLSPTDLRSAETTGNEHKPCFQITRRQGITFYLQCGP